MSQSVLLLLIILGKAVGPRKAQKARKTRNKSRQCIDLLIYPLGEGLQFCISLKIFVLFVDEMIFLGLFRVFCVFRGQNRRF